MSLFNLSHPAPISALFQHLAMMIIQLFSVNYIMADKPSSNAIQTWLFDEIKPPLYH